MATAALVFKPPTNKKKMKVDNIFEIQDGVVIPKNMLSLLSGKDNWNELRNNVMRELSNCTTFEEFVDKIDDAYKGINILLYDMNLLVPVQKPIKKTDTGEAKFDLKSAMLGLNETNKPIPITSEPSSNYNKGTIPTQEVYEAKVKLFIKKGVFNPLYHPDYYIGCIESANGTNLFCLYNREGKRLIGYGNSEQLFRDICEEGIQL